MAGCRRQSHFIGLIKGLILTLPNGSIRGSMMAEFNREIAGKPFGGAMSGAEAAAIDAGLRAYMLRVYNYMILGLAITGIAALGIYMLSVTDDLTAAAKVVTTVYHGDSSEGTDSTGGKTEAKRVGACK